MEAFEIEVDITSRMQYGVRLNYYVDMTNFNDESLNSMVVGHRK